MNSKYRVKVGFLVVLDLRNSDYFDLCISTVMSRKKAEFNSRDYGVKPIIEK